MGAFKAYQDPAKIIGTTKKKKKALSKQVHQIQQR